MPDQSMCATCLGLEIDPAPENYTPLEAVAVVKALDEHGILRLLVRPTTGVTAWEAVGMLTVALDVERREITDEMED